MRVKSERDEVLVKGEGVERHIQKFAMKPAASKPELIITAE